MAVSLLQPCESIREVVVYTHRMGAVSHSLRPQRFSKKGPSGWRGRLGLRQKHEASFLLACIEAAEVDEFGLSKSNSEKLSDAGPASHAHMDV